MKTSIVRALTSLKNSLISRGMPLRRPQHRRSQFFSRLMVEKLEDRRLLAILYVDNPGDYIITNDQGGAGLDNGDTVTWDPGAGSQHGGPVTGLTFGTDAFGSIGAAITAATAGDTVQVGPGTFNESVNVNKQLFVLGNQNGLDAQTRVGAPESIVDGGGGTLNVGVSDVVIDGFTIQGATNAATGFGVTLIGGTSGSEIRNNIIQNNIAGLSLANNSAASQTVIEQNLFLTNNAAGPVSGTAIYTDQFNAGGALTNVLIDNNTFRGNTSSDGVSGSAIGLSSTLAGSQTNIHITRNIFDGNGRAIYAFNLVDSSFSENEVSGALFVTSADLRLFEGIANFTVNNNILLGNGTDVRAVRISNSGTGAPNATGITFEQNSISGYGDTTLDSPTNDDDAGLQVDALQYDGPLDAQFNWWGSPTGPTIAGNPGGLGEEIVDPDGVVEYIPFLPNGVDAEPEARGFQPVIDLSITKTGSSDTVSPGQQLTYTIIVSNNGVFDIENVSLSDLIPVDTTFVSFTAPPGWTSTTPPVGDTGVVTSEIPLLAVGESATFTLVVQVDPTAAGGTLISNTAVVTTTTVETDDTNNASSVDATVAAVLQECEVVTLNQPGALGSSTLGDDADNPGSGVLIVTGTNNNDTIVIEERPVDHSQIRVKINGQLKGIYNKSDVQHIVAFGLNGIDTIVVGWNLEQNATLFGGARTDYLFGGAGKDQIDGGTGNDHLFGGWDTDTLCGGDGNDFLYGQWNDDFLGGDSGNDFLFGAGGNDLLLGGVGTDYLFGGLGNDRLFGQAGNDNLFGENGNDIAAGGDGNDRLWGGIGNDLLIGGNGDDTLYGEGHDDILVANSTAWDNDELALMAILSEWTSSNSYSTRVNNIRSGGGANGGFTLNSGTVPDDSRPDTLWGNAGQDWFLVGVTDKIRDKAANELVN